MYLVFGKVLLAFGPVYLVFGITDQGGRSCADWWGYSPKGKSSNIRYFESQQLDTLHNPIWTNVLLTSINYTIIKPKPACFHATVENYVLLQKIGVAERSPTPAADHWAPKTGVWKYELSIT